MGVEVLNDGSVYEGPFFEGKKHGLGTYTWPNNSKYIGNFNMDQIEGKGFYSKPDGSQLEGIWKDNKIVEILTKKPKNKDIVFEGLSLSNTPKLAVIVEETKEFEAQDDNVSDEKEGAIDGNISDEEYNESVDLKMGSLNVNTLIKSQLIMKTEILDKMMDEGLDDMAEGVSASNFETSSQQMSNYATPVRLIPKAIKHASQQYISKTHTSNKK